jgi:GNAT superfamily N-acetyltransferase
VFTPAEDWWRDLPGVYELSIETSRDWRRQGIARGLLEFCMRPTWIEHVILLAMGLDWHWDLEHAGLDGAGYRAMLRRLFESVGFRTMRTAEPNVGMHASNVLLMRTGAKVAPERLAALNEALYVAPWQRERLAR